MRAGPTCQRVKADLPPAGRPYPLPVPTRRGGCVSLDFLGLPVARSGRDFVQVHIAQGPPGRAQGCSNRESRKSIRTTLAGRVWLVPTFKTPTAGAQLGRVGAPRRGAARRARLGPRHALRRRSLDGPARGASLIFGSLAARLPPPRPQTQRVKARTRPLSWGE